MLRFIPILMAVAAIGLAGCIAFPVQSGEEVPFETQRFDFIEIGRTTREEIRDAMSQFQVESGDGPQTLNLQPVEYRGGKTWLYGAAREEQRWMYLILAGYYGDFGVTGSQDYYYLQVDFDDSGVVSGYTLSRSEGHSCNRAGVCTANEAFMLLAGEEDNQRAKQFAVNEGFCGVYLYASRLPLGAPVWLDGRRVGWLTDRYSYLHWEVEPGFHRIESRTPFEKLRQLSSFDCEAGELRFLEIRQKGSVGRESTETTWRQPQADAARREIRERKRLLNVSHFPEPAESS